MFRHILMDQKNKDILTKGIKNNRINHCYIFIGPKGTNKGETAIEFAKAILCNEVPKPCNECLSCKRISNKNHPDIIEVWPQESSIRIDQIRRIQTMMGTKAYEGNYKIFLIYDCDTMGIPAQNALLKSLEEPNKGVIIILMSESREKIIPTILSRGQILKFKPMSKITFLDLMDREYSHVDKEDLELIYDLSQASIGKIRSIIENPAEIELFKEFQSNIFQILKGNYQKIFQFSKWIKDNKFSNEYVLDNLLIIFRNILRDKYMDRNTIYNHAGKYLTNKLIHDIIEDIIEEQSSLKYNVNFQLQIENMLLRIQEEKIANDQSNRSAF